MVKRLLVTEPVGGNSSNVLRVVALLLKTGIVMEGKKLLKMQNWRRANFSEDSCHTQEDLSESLDGYQRASDFKTSETVENDWERRILMLHELKPRRDVERRLFACEQILKGFLHRIVTGDENMFMLDLMRWAKVVKKYLDTLKWKTLPHPPYSPDVVPSDFHLTHLAQWHTAWLTSTSARMKKCKIGSTHGSYRKMKGVNYRRIEYVSNGNSDFCYRSSTNGVHVERGRFGPRGVEG
nr:histone lysine N methyltransferase SETMAR [Hymenolepis microstoma]